MLRQAQIETAFLMEACRYIGVLAVVQVMAIFVLRRWLSTILSFDVACGGLLLCLMIISAIKDEFSLEYIDAY